MVTDGFMVSSEVPKSGEWTRRLRPRIVHLTTSHDPRDIRVFRKECLSLRKVFQDVHLVAPFKESYEDQGVCVHAVPPHAGRIGRIVRTLPRVYSVARRLTADIYHLHDPDLLVLAPLLRRSGARVIFDSHEDYPRDLYSRPYLKGFFGRAIVWAYTAFERRIFRRLDAVVTVNRAMTERVSKIQRNTVTVYNFPIAKELPEPKNVPGSPSKVVWLGLLNAARGVATLDAAARQLPPGTIEVIGRCDDIDPVTSALVYLGRMEYQEALKRTADYAAGLATFASHDFHQDMFPIKLFEYMLMGLPLVASNFPKWKCLFGDADCAILVDPDDANDIARAVQWVLRNPSEARAMGLRGRSLALRKYSWQTEAKKLVGLYGNLLGSAALGDHACEYLPFDPSGAEAPL